MFTGVTYVHLFPTLRYVAGDCYTTAVYARCYVPLRLRLRCWALILDGHLHCVRPRCVHDCVVVHSYVPVYTLVPRYPFGPYHLHHVHTPFYRVYVYLDFCYHVFTSSFVPFTLRAATARLPRYGLIRCVHVCVVHVSTPSHTFPLPLRAYLHTTPSTSLVHRTYAFVACVALTFTICGSFSLPFTLLPAYVPVVDPRWWWCLGVDTVTYCPFLPHGGIVVTIAIYDLPLLPHSTFGGDIVTDYCLRYTRFVTSHPVPFVHVVVGYGVVR